MFETETIELDEGRTASEKEIGSIRSALHGKFRLNVSLAGHNTKDPPAHQLHCGIAISVYAGVVQRVAEVEWLAIVPCPWREHWGWRFTFRS